MDATTPWTSRIRQSVRGLRSKFFNPGANLALLTELHERFARYQTDSLQGIDPAAFRRQILGRIGTLDAAAEGYSDAELERQRDLSIKFHWGHDHDFGDFQVRGRMASRHLDLMADFASIFGLDLDSFQDKEVLDVGCWTGGTSLLLAALGCRVVAIEEVCKYAEAASFLARSFGLQTKLTVHPISLYACNHADWYDRFDIVHFPGVIYHLSDPLIGLRILFNALRPDGTILVESAGIDHAEPFCRFDGSMVWQSGDKNNMDRGGWNWFMPSPSALARMMREAGFEQVETLWNHVRQKDAAGRHLQGGPVDSGDSLTDRLAGGQGSGLVFTRLD
jgi:SAM-dependent methyltransferase